jgi:hypothetical protein
MSFEDEYNMLPKAVGCSRGPFNRRTYDAEFAVNGVHYVVGIGYSSHAIALEVVRPYVDELHAAYKAAADAMIARNKWPKAKP